MKNYNQTILKFKGTKLELIEAVRMAKIESRKQVEGTNILASLPKVELIGRRLLSISNKHVSSSITDFTKVPNNNILEGTITYGVDSSWIH